MTFYSTCFPPPTDNTANILTRRGGFSRREMSMYFLPVVISDNDYPIQSSTSTLIVRVCACDSRGNMQTCNPEVLPFSDGLTTGALVAILLCVVILLSKPRPPSSASVRFVCACVCDRVYLKSISITSPRTQMHKLTSGSSCIICTRNNLMLRFQSCFNVPLVTVAMRGWLSLLAQQNLQ